MPRGDASAFDLEHSRADSRLMRVERTSQTGCGFRVSLELLVGDGCGLMGGGGASVVGARFVLGRRDVDAWFAR